MSSWVVAASLPAAGNDRLYSAGGGSRRRRWFDFPDEEEDAPTWADDIRAQALDLGLVVAFLALAFVSFFRKSVPLKYVTLVAAVVFIGFWKSQLISIVNVFGLFGGNLPIFRYNLAWYLLAAITARLDGPVGTRLLRPDLRVRRADAADGSRCCRRTWQFNVPRAIERRASLDQVRHPRRARSSTS